jgi:hypothetical protein
MAVCTERKRKIGCLVISRIEGAGIPRTSRMSFDSVCQAFITTSVADAWIDAQLSDHGKDATVGH